MKLFKLPSLLPIISLLLILILFPFSQALASEEDPARYVVTLLTSSEPLETVDLTLSGKYLTYVTSFKRKGELLYRLRLGFFPSREEAEKMLPSLSSRYPTAGATRVPKREKRQVIAGQILSQSTTLITAGN